ncbi:hypothetical protein CC80DRAFT_69633 [Byssothecium circinans]|uniref:Uncharacterized protein n=1 Tax=Byssothecium circinans TaxID=147558 RepID=A0A6A5TWL9_9PLEO|nr:hypothetical protein CC80DRAFT_69633 [Byssothecium circinans]
MQRRNDPRHPNHSGESRTAPRQEQPRSSRSGHEGDSSGDEYTSNEYTSNQYSSSRHQSTQSNGDSYGSSPHHQYQHDYAQQQWHEVPRYRVEDNSEAYRAVIEHPTLNRSPMAPDSSTRARLSHASITQRSPQHTYQPQSSRDGARENARPQLTSSQLDQYNARRTPTTNIAIWRGTQQRDSAWDNVGYVRTSQSDDGHRRSDGC